MCQSKRERKRRPRNCSIRLTDQYPNMFKLYSSPLLLLVFSPQTFQQLLFWITLIFMLGEWRTPTSHWAYPWAPWPPLPTSLCPINAPFLEGLSTGNLSWALKPFSTSHSPEERLPLLGKLFPPPVLIAGTLSSFRSQRGHHCLPVEVHLPFPPDCPLFWQPICFFQSPYNHLPLFYYCLFFVVSPSRPWLHLLKERKKERINWWDG